MNNQLRKNYDTAVQTILNYLEDKEFPDLRLEWEQTPLDILFWSECTKIEIKVATKPSHLIKTMSNLLIFPV